jgi:MFS family permease
MTAEPDAVQPPEARSGSADDTRLSRPLIRYAIGNAMATLGEWGALIGLLVHVFERSGPNAVGIASFTAILPYVFAAPFTARLAERFRPATVRVVGMLGQALGFGIAATAIALDGPIWTAVLGTAIGYVAATSLRPAAAVLLPAVVRSSRELTTVNVWVGNGDTSALLLGPLMATVLLAVQGPAASLAGCAAMSLGAAALTASFMRNGPPPAGYDESHDDTRPRQHRALGAITGPFADVAGVFKKPGARAVLLVAAAQFILVGASDVIWVVLAGEHLDLGDAGAGVLSALFGAGSLLCVTVSGRAARRSRLAPMMIGCLVLIALGCLVLGAAIALVTVIVLVPLIGLSRGLVDVLARVLLQRSAPPSELPSVFGAAETIAGLGGLAGSLIAQVLIAWSGVETALITIGILFVLAAAALVRPLRSADDAADVPVVAMSLLRQYPVFAPLPEWSLEVVARSAREVEVGDGTAVIHEGEHGDAFYAVVDGEFLVTADGEYIRTVRRGDGFGEIALIADIPRTGTVTASGPGSLLAIDRDDFLLAVTGHEPAHDAAWHILHTKGFGHHRTGDGEAPRADADPADHS